MSVTNIRTPTILRQNNTNVLYFTLSVVALLLLLWITSDAVSLERKLLSTALILIASIPTYHFLFTIRQLVVPLMAINCLTYIVIFGMNGFFYMETEHYLFAGLKEESWVNGQILAIVGLLCQITTYFLSRSLFASAKPIRILVGMDPGRVALMGVGLLCLRMLAYLVPMLNEVPTFGEFIKCTPYVGFGLLVMLSAQGKFSTWVNILLYGVALPIEIVIRLNSGAIYLPVMMGIFVFLIRWVVSRKTNWWFFILAIILYSVFNPIKHEYRQVVWNTTAGKEKSSLEKLSLFFELASDYWLGDTKSQEVRSNLMSRLNHLSVAAVVTEMTPNQVPYWNGETLEYAMVAYIPRFLWPDKPSLVFGNKFGIRYGVIVESNETTTINITWVVELYANFGYTAVIVGMSLIGIAFALLERWVATPGTAMIDCILPLSIVFQLIYPENNIVLMWGGVVTMSITFYAIAYALKQ